MNRLTLLAACAVFATLSACGGGGGDSGGAATTPVASSPAALKTTDTLVGSGVTAANGDRVQVNYTGWLYSTGTADFKGSKFDASVAGKPLTFVIGATGTAESVIPGFGQGVLGMKVGGKRTVLIPAALGYGSKGVYDGSVAVIPPNSGLVFEVELVKDCGLKTC